MTQFEEIKQILDKYHILYKTEESEDEQYIIIFRCGIHFDTFDEIDEIFVD